MSILEGMFCSHMVTLEEIWMKNGPTKENNKKCHVANFLYYFTFMEGYSTFIKATLNIYFILQLINADEV